MGKARAMADWKCLVRTWNAWKSYVRNRKLDEEVAKQQQEVKNTQR